MYLFSKTEGKRQRERERERERGSEEESDRLREGERDRECEEHYEKQIAIFIQSKGVCIFVKEKKRQNYQKNRFLFTTYFMLKK